jgi:molybdopterin/thiamine biosynthesis adenylyltransferase
MLTIENQNSRFHRQELITWWDQTVIQRSKVLVVGAGALGNEVVKNLALVGVGTIEVCDMDSIENSNLSRCVFFRESDIGLKKAAVLAGRASEIYEEVNVSSHEMPIQRLGVAYLRKFDIVIGALDNREARAWVNQACRKLGKTWIDGAIEGLRGLVRGFSPESACYECTLTEADFKQMSHRRSCALLSPDDLLEGKTPTNATTASVVAGVQVQEAIKFLSNGLPGLTLQGKAWMFTGDSMDSYQVGYQADDFCMAHDAYSEFHELAAESLADLVDDVSTRFNQPVIAVDFEEELISFGPCGACGNDGSTLGLRSSLQLGAGKCALCKTELPAKMEVSIDLDHQAMNFPLLKLGFGVEDLVSLRTEEQRIHYVVRGHGG